MKKAYSSPVFEVEEFAANEYVAVCFAVACDSDTANAGEGGNYSANPVGSQVNHNGGCSVASNNLISGSNGVYYVYEQNTGISDISGSQLSGSVYDGAIVKWTTSSSANGYTRVWHHVGTVTTGVNRS